MKKLLLILTILTLAGCSTAAEKQSATTAFYAAQSAHETAQAVAVKPVFEMKGIAGQSIELKGVQSLTVWGGNNASQQAAFQAAPVQQSEFSAGLREVRETVLGVMPYALGAAAIRGVSSLGDNIQRGSTAGYPYVQAPLAPQANYSYGANSGVNSGNSGNIAAGTSSTVTAPIATATPTVVNQPAPVVVVAPNPVIVPTAPPVVVNPCVIAASGVGTCL